MEFNDQCTRTYEYDTKDMKEVYFESVFIKEGKHRFICTILINNVLEECYVSSSSKLSNYIQLENCKILVSQNTNSKLRTRFTLEAAVIDKRLVYLNLNYTNNLYNDYLLHLGYDNKIIQREMLINKLIKTDFFIDNVGCVEVKSLLSNERCILFPDKTSKRICVQLKQYISLLQTGIPVTFAFIAMSKEIECLGWSSADVENDFKKAISLGLNIEAFCVEYDKNAFKLVKNDILRDHITVNLK